MTNEAKYYFKFTRFCAKRLNSRAGFSATILFLINILIYVDRQSVIGATKDILAYFGEPSGWQCLVQTAFMFFQIVALPFCGYYGDRFNRKRILFGGMLVWTTGVIGSALSGRNEFVLFMVFRAIVGVGQAVFTVITPCILSDMFAGQERRFVLNIFYLAAPFGSGLGYLIGTDAWYMFSQWQWRIGITAIFELIGIIMFVIWVKEPERGRSDKELMELQFITPTKAPSFLTDLRCILRNPSYVYSTIAYTTLIFATGSLLWWMPTVAATKFNSRFNTDLYFYYDIFPYLGYALSTFGVIGINFGGYISMVWQSGRAFCCKNGKNDKASCFICAIGSGVSCFLLLLALLTKSEYGALQYILLFSFMISVNFGLGLNVDTIMTLAAPWRRCTAVSWFLLISHLLGDWPGPFIIGALAGDIWQNNAIHLRAYERFGRITKSLFLLVPMLAISTIMYIASAAWITKDLRKVKNEIRKDCGNAPIVEEANWEPVESRKGSISTVSSW